MDRRFLISVQKVITGVIIAFREERKREEKNSRARVIKAFCGL